jgi:hypothetical protein
MRIQSSISVFVMARCFILAVSLQFDEYCDRGKIGEALQTSPIQMRLSGVHPDTVRQKTSVFICVARLKKVLIELFRHPVPELESLV